MNRDTATLISAERFAANPKIQTAPEMDAQADQLMDAMVGRYCAGLRFRVRGQAVRHALCGPPVQDGQMATVIRWLLGSLRIPDLHTLAWRCGVPVIRLADHVRSQGVTNRHVIGWLNQFGV
ncbi:MAG: hypothetical protein OXF72_05175 [Gammaproteobacteria bacterium]|nr:hypothetical protein [Gammaproteobacteria bacterium]MCY4198620.1 hypothetical protein [Gammaproteobacteria bacterium]MCY4277714.1 hypothetical protein [Gammaproteobacteria bacterium]MCY4324299.1 hypothetical protein [Gammaproteobacteria bacterium]